MSQLQAIPALLAVGLLAPATLACTVGEVGQSQDAVTDTPAAAPDTTGIDFVQSEAAPPPDTAVACQEGPYAYLHGDLWPMWYNMRVVCDPEHRALWRCERTHGQGATQCAPQRQLYEGCIADPYCLNWGVCSFTGTSSCEEPDAEHLAVCDTRAVDYDSDEVWGTYYGWQWGSSTTKHRFTTIHIWNEQGDRIAAFSSNPGEGDAYMDGTNNHGVGPDPQGVIQVIEDKYEDRFGTFACVRLPAGSPLTLQGFWMYVEFPHTCQSSYASQPYTPCKTEKLSLVAEAGRHYLWTERGIEQLPGCSGPPPEIAKWLPQASCSTAQ